MPFLRAFRMIVTLAMVAASATLLFLAARRAPADLPWVPLDLGQPIGLSTQGKLRALIDAPQRCRAVLDRAGIAYRTLPSRATASACAVADGIVWHAAGARTAIYVPAAPALACPLAAALALWEWDVVQPAAVATLGSPVVRIDHYGSYACRHLYGRAAGDWSEHARARAIDVAGFRLADGRHITIAADWGGHGPEAAFLHALRDGGCRLFATTLSPDYNAAHRDHLHLDEAARLGSLCR